MIALRVLGAFAVLRENRPLALPPSRKTRALLAYLAVVGQPQRREHLCGMFWNAPDDLKGALRWSLSKIRQVVNLDGHDVLGADRNTVALDAQAIALDLRQARALPQDLGSCDVALLEQIAAALEGGFLPDLSLPRCPEFEAWRVSQASGVDLLRARILRALIERLAGEPGRALPHALALQAMDPGNESLPAEIAGLTRSARSLAVSAPDAGRGVGAMPASLSAGEEPQSVTVLAVEIVNPLHGFKAVPPDVVSRQIDPLLESMHEIIERYSGVVSASGDSGITALFGSATGENHAASACRAALAVKSTIERQAAGEVRVRAGLDSGEVIVRRRRRGMTERIEVTGIAARNAARLVHALRRGVLALTERTCDMAASLVQASPLPRSDYPRFDRDEQIYELLGERALDEPSSR